MPKIPNHSYQCLTSGQLLGMTHTQVEAAVSQNYQRLLLKAGIFWNAFLGDHQLTSHIYIETRQSTLNAVIRVDFIVPEPESQTNKRKADQNSNELSQKKKKKNKAKNNKAV